VGCVERPALSHALSRDSRAIGGSSAARVKRGFGSDETHTPVRKSEGRAFIGQPSLIKDTGESDGITEEVDEVSGTSSEANTDR
jgi:hypothetical protein